MAELEKKTPPQNIDAEQSVLGAILIDSEAIQKIIEILVPEYFYKNAHQIIFQTMLDLLMKAEPVDLVTLSEKLRISNDLERVGGMTYLTDLVDVVSTSANIEYYAKIVEEKAILRNLITTGSNIVEQAFSESLEITDILDSAEQQIFKVADKRMKKGFTHIGNILGSVMDEIEAMYNNEISLLGLSSGFVDFDRITSGFQNSDLIILAARPSMGKTALALNFAMDAAVRQGKSVGIFSLEMSKESLVSRMLCAHAQIDSNKLKTGNLQDNDWKKLMRSLGKLDEAKIYIDDSASMTALEVRAKARRIQAERGLDLIVIDYLQLMHGSKKNSENRTQEISEIARQVKAIARELKVPVMALSQLSRSIEQRNDKTPKLSDLRESGEIEQTADLVVFIHREDFYDHQNAGPNSLTDIIIAKHRNGPTGKCQLVFQKDITKFRSKETTVDEQ
ncbi:MAG: replicative DNA helicase [Candidatus Margulisbacteria bacterium]|nr:replicative DNA helicase [Candidatus Margulisiibacteriota bacterium]